MARDGDIEGTGPLDLPKRLRGFPKSFIYSETPFQFADGPFLFPRTSCSNRQTGPYAAYPSNNVTGKKSMIGKRAPCTCGMMLGSGLPGVAGRPRPGPSILSHIRVNTNLVDCSFRAQNFASLICVPHLVLGLQTAEIYNPPSPHLMWASSIMLLRLHLGSSAVKWRPGETVWSALEVILCSVGT